LIYGFWLLLWYLQTLLKQRHSKMNSFCTYLLQELKRRYLIYYLQKQLEVKTTRTSFYAEIVRTPQHRPQIVKTHLSYVLLHILYDCYECKKVTIVKWDVSNPFCNIKLTQTIINYPSQAIQNKHTKKLEKHCFKSLPHLHKTKKKENLWYGICHCGLIKHHLLLFTNNTYI
jgi:hypothetical protein